MIVLIDNYDSFTYNLVQYLGELGAHVKVFRNDKVTVKAIADLKPERIVISPGPGGPQDAGISCDVIREFCGTMPILGVCLGHQCIGAAFGGTIVRARKLMHGKTSDIYHDGTGIFRGLDNPLSATRYHSLVVERKSLPQALRITARTSDNEIMGLCHRKFAVWGVQFHPESIMTSDGKKLLSNFLGL
ncbi:MAG: aminodeoxychorismate/anthranilate synthase component II [Candidatus Omnitrophica bacterium]|nr:aminodeoxychorismate/anthranilate synthase component II [Candidatus Omnitrophota bacterium]